jgi:hypothetical protein
MPYVEVMTELLDRAIEIARALPAQSQDEIAQLILDLTSNDEETAESLSPDDEASFDESIAQDERGEFVSDKDVQAFWAKIGV